MHIYRKQGGFTLVEVLLTIAILGVLTGIGVAFYQNFQVSNQLDVTGFEIVQTLRRAQARAMARDTDQPYGVHFETRNTILFPGSTYNPTNPANEALDVPGTLSIATSFGPDVVFARLKGEPSATGTVTIASTINESKIITINAVGTIDQ